MLDAFIIDRIRREREEPRDAGQIPLHIEEPREMPRLPELPVEREDEEDRQKRGVVIVDFTI